MVSLQVSQTPFQLGLTDIVMNNVTRREDGTLKVGVLNYRKHTHTNRYLPYESHHPYHVKRGVIRSLVGRAVEISSVDSLLKKEMRHLRTVLAENGYPSNLVGPSYSKCNQKASQVDDDDEEEKPVATAIIPYTQGLSEQIRRVLR